MDREGQPLVAIANEEFVRQFFPGQNPVGSRIRWARDTGPPRWITIVGVVGDVKHSGLNQPTDPAVYTPFPQADEAWKRWMTLTIRTDNSFSGLVEQVKAQVWSVDGQIPVSDVQTMEQRMAVSFAQQRFYMLLLGAFASLAAILAGVGIYGVVAYTASQSTHEIGIRMALGGQRRDVLRLIMAEAAKLTSAGILIGIVGALALTRAMASLLFEVKPGDPVILAAGATVLALVALVACYIPARRAAQGDPMVALRYE
jgi:putative ABC transport system permease protein